MPLFNGLIMANEVIINIPGIGDVVAENAASESTLRSILSAIESNGRSTGGTTTSSSSTANTTRERERADSHKKTISVFSQLTSTTGSLISSFSNLHGSVTAAANATSNFTKQIPLVGDTLAVVFKNVAAAQRELITSYQKASTVGATFAGSINEFAAYASAASQTLDEFSAFISANGNSLALLGDTTEEGAKRFSVLSKTLRETSTDLYSLGYSTKDFNAGLMQYTQNQMYYGNVGKKTNAELVAGTKAYMKELDILAKITGESREKVANDMATINLDTDFRSYIDSLGANSEKAGMELGSTLKSVPDSMQKFLKDVITHGVPTTADTQAAWSVFPEIGRAAMKYKQSLDSGTATAADTQNLLNVVASESAVKNKDATVNLAKWSESGMGFAKKMAMDGVAFDAERRKKATAAQDATLQEQEKYNQKYEAFKTKIIEVGNKFTDVLASSGAFGLLTRVFDVFTNIIDKVSVPIFKSFGNVIGSITKVLDTSLGPTFKMFDAWLGELPDIMTAVFNTVFGPDMKSITDKFTSWLNPVSDSLNGFAEDMSKLSPADQAKAAANWIATSIEHLFENIQFTWIGVQQKLVEVASSLVSPILNTGIYLQQFALVMEEQVDNIRKSMNIYDMESLNENIKLGILGFQVGIDSVISKWNAVESWIDKVAIGLSHFSDMMNYIKVLDPRSKYSSADYDKDKAQNEQYRYSLRKDIDERKNFDSDEKEAHLKAYEAEKKTVETLADQKKADLVKELDENETNRNARKKHLAKLIEDNSIAEAKWNEALTNYATKLSEEDAKLLAKSEERDAIRGAIVNEELDNAKVNSAAANKYAATTDLINENIKKGSLASGAAFAANTTDEAAGRMIAMAETGGKSIQNAAGGKAAGMHQWMPKTWESVTASMGKKWDLSDRFDPAKSTEAMNFIIGQYRNKIEPGLGRRATPAELYMLHFLGAGGGSKFLRALQSNPNQSVQGVVGTDQFKQNMGVFAPHGHVRSVQEVFDEMSSRLTRGSTTAANATQKATNPISVNSFANANIKSPTNTSINQTALSTAAADKQARDEEFKKQQKEKEAADQEKAKQQEQSNNTAVNQPQGDYNTPYLESIANHLNDLKMVNTELLQVNHNQLSTQRGLVGNGFVR